MSIFSCLFSRPRLRFAVLLCFSFSTLTLGDVGNATTRTELYQATAPVSDRSEASQTAAFQSAMRTVLVRVTGRRTAEQDPALAPLIGNARRYVQQFRAASDNQLWVAFDGAAIERWLTQNGQPLWGRERPTTAMIVAVQGAGGAGTVITADDTSELKASIDAAANARGLPLLWPSAADAQRDHLDYAAVSSGSAAALGDIGKRLGGEGVLIGRASGNTATANVRWIHLFQDHSTEYSGTVEGVNRAADLYAGLFAASWHLGASRHRSDRHQRSQGICQRRKLPRVSDIHLSHVSVQSLTGDTVGFRLATRGGGESLQRALSLSGRLQPIAAGGRMESSASNYIG